MKTIFTLLLLCIICGCGQPVEITYHYETPMTELQQMAGFTVFGHARWKNHQFDTKDPFDGHVEGHTQCDVYVAPKAILITESCFNAVVAHETRHCHEGHFHPEDGHSGYLLECQEAADTWRANGGE